MGDQVSVAQKDWLKLYDVIFKWATEAGWNNLDMIANLEMVKAALIADMVTQKIMGDVASAGDA